LRQVGPDPLASLLVRGGAAGFPAAEAGFHSAVQARRIDGSVLAPWGEIDGEDSELTSGIRVGGSSRLTPDPEVAVLVGDNRSAEELGPVRGRHHQGGHEYCTDPISTSLGHKAVEEGRGGNA
jgi:hypothetical protein